MVLASLVLALLTNWFVDFPGVKVPVNADEGQVAPYELEDPLMFADGRKVADAALWLARRQEILGIFEREMYGRRPPLPEALVAELADEKVTVGGFAIRRQYDMWFRADRTGPKVRWIVWIPRMSVGRVPVILWLNSYGNQSLVDDPDIPLMTAWHRNGKYAKDNRVLESTRGLLQNPDEPTVFPVGMLLARGYAVMSACYCEVSPDPNRDDFVSDPRPQQDELAYTGVFDLWPRRDPKGMSETTSLGAWSWALSRGLDLAERIPEIDARKSVVTGCSRLGKAALLAAAYDERFAVCVPVQTGNGGVPLAKRNFGENPATETRQFTHWFCRAYEKYREEPWKTLPFDQHLLLSAIAPRALLVLGFGTSPWFDCRGEYLSCRAASDVWEFLTGEGLPRGGFPAYYSTASIGGRLGYACRLERHGISAQDWTWIADFADRQFGKAAGAVQSSSDAMSRRALWRRYLDPPSAYVSFPRTVRKVAVSRHGDVVVESYEQANGPTTRQRVMMAVPANLKGKAPCVIVPYYFPEGVLGFNPKTGGSDSPPESAETTRLDAYKACVFMADLARRGYITISADAYNLTYAQEGSPADSWSKWRHAAEALKRDWPGWTGIGKLLFDTRLLVDLAAADPRVDAGRIGIIGHSLGGKMAFYAGCLDPRIKAVVASDFGMGWTQSNWSDVWYWGDLAGRMRTAGATHADLLSYSGGKPFCLVAGHYDDADSGAIMRAAQGYENASERLLLLHHGKGHRPPRETTEKAYRFLARWLREPVSNVLQDGFQRLIDEAAERGGGRVVVPAGRHVMGGLVLRSNVELHLEKGAVLEGAPRTNDYPHVTLPYSEGTWMAVVMAVGATNVAITGEGEIFGNGSVFQSWRKPFPPGVCAAGTRPRGLFFGNCRNVRLEGFALRDTGSWGCVLQGCEEVAVRRVTVDNHGNYNNDGIDIEARNVVIEGCDIDAGDDGVCIKSNNPHFTVENVLVTNCVLRSHCVPFKIGTATHGIVRNVVFADCRTEAPRRDFDISETPLRYRPANWRVWCERDFPGSVAGEPAALSAIAVECVDGGTVEDVVCRDIVIDGGCYVPIFVRANRRLSRTNGTPRGTTEMLRRIRFENISGHSVSAVPSSVTGIPEFRVKDVSLRNVRLVGRGGGENAAERTRPVPECANDTPSAGMFMQALPAYGLWARHVDGLSVEDSSFSLEDGAVDLRESVVFDDVK